MEQRTRTTRKRVNRPWTISPLPQADNCAYEIRSGGDVIGQVASRGDAEMICRARRDAMRQAMGRASDFRFHKQRADSMRRDIEALIEGLKMASHCLKRTTSPRDVLRAREEINKLLKIMRAHGHST